MCQVPCRHLQNTLRKPFVNTNYFYRGPKRSNLFLALFELRRQPFGKVRGNRENAETAGPAEFAAAKLAFEASKVTAAEDGPEVQNTSFMDRVTVLRALVERHLKVAAQNVDDDLKLSRPAFCQQSLLNLAAAIDLQFAVYLPESFGPELTFAKLVEQVLGSESGTVFLQ
jgi:hypothetical protein